MAFPRVDFRAPRTMRAGVHEPYALRSASTREMVSGLVSWCLHQAVKDYGKKHKRATYKVYEDIGIGNSTQSRMVECRQIAQTTALKILKYLGTDVRSVLTKYQQKVTK